MSAERVKLTKAESVALRWCENLAGSGGVVGYLGPTVRKEGPLPELAGAVRRGLLDVRLGNETWQQDGYFITDAGRAALAGDRS